MLKIYTILILLFNVIFRRKHYTLTFVAEYDGPIKRWYYKFKHWGFEHKNLEMVAGADAMCEFYAEGKDEVTVDIIASKKQLNLPSQQYDEYIAENIIIDGLTHQGDFINSQLDKILYGRTYEKIKENLDGKLVITTMWICPVTLFVLGRYPNYLYIKKHK